ncbi:hypothetical protein FGO68_gene13238 [Halteria grandinella]|uniref:Uncharacterized protein n=1 Tax=Halteria grandinella TaxID=5974 RepID=A0A8J8NFT2_HALGN|nr:hypothetical protein FGO68_gene13238 [Halteria grandinella]
MRPVVTNHPSPPVFINKMKNEQIVEDRFTEIERENRILFEKITQIHLKGLAGPGKISNLLHQSEFKDRHFIDSVSATISGSNSARKLSTIQSNSGKPGEAQAALDLKRVKDRLRQLDQVRLFKDNMKFLDRLRNSKGTIDMSKFSEFEKQHKAYKKNLTESTNLIHNIKHTSIISDQHSLYQRSTSVSKGPNNQQALSIGFGNQAHATESSSKGFFNQSLFNGNMHSTNHSNNIPSAERLPQIQGAQQQQHQTATQGFNKLGGIDSFNDYNIQKAQLPQSNNELTALQKYQQQSIKHKEMTVVLEQSAMAALSKKRYRTKPKRRRGETQRDYFEEFEQQQRNNYVDNQGNLYTNSDTHTSKFTDRKVGGSTKRKRGKQASLLTSDEEQLIEQSLFKSKMFVDEVDAFMTIEVVRKGTHKVFIRAWNNKLLMKSEVELHLKQACSYLMYYGNDFERFIKETIMFHPTGKISLMDMHKIRYLAAIQGQFAQQSSIDSLNQLPSKNIQEEDYEEDYGGDEATGRETPDLIKTKSLGSSKNNAVTSGHTFKKSVKQSQESKNFNSSITSIQNPPSQMAAMPVQLKQSIQSNRTEAHANAGIIQDKQQQDRSEGGHTAAYQRGITGNIVQENKNKPGAGFQLDADDDEGSGVTQQVGKNKQDPERDHEDSNGGYTGDELGNDRIIKAAQSSFSFQNLGKK